eukprot:5765296-Pyramimonas_sp.AAC.1
MAWEKGLVTNCKLRARRFHLGPLLVEVRLQGLESVALVEELLLEPLDLLTSLVSAGLWRD